MKESARTRCQVATPPDIVQLLWDIAHRSRKGKAFPSVVDLGAGDARFAASGRYGSYTGIELDPKRHPAFPLRANARFLHKDAMRLGKGAYSLAIGNPPYIRHHHLEPDWRDESIVRLAKAGGPLLKSTANSFVMFLLQAILQTQDDGLIVQLVPFEWVTRPSALELRDYIKDNGWSVRVFRFKADIFPTVLTTASITVIDKASKTGEWLFGEIDREGNVAHTTNPSGTKERVLPYQGRDGRCHALRGLSPGSQSIFVLNEEQRLFHGLRKVRDVMPCVTSLRNVSKNLEVLDRESFDEEYVRKGRLCWLIRSDKVDLSPELSQYLKQVGTAWKAFSTCTNRERWWQYRNHPVSQALVSSGFIDKGPKVLVNEVGAMAVGSVYGVHIDDELSVAEVSNGVRRYDFRRRVVSHANNLKKIEIGQLNAVLKRLFG